MLATTLEDFINESYVSDIKEEAKVAANTYDCNDCEKQFATSDELIEHSQSHMANVKEKRRYSCVKCNAEYSKLCYLRNHMLREHDEELSPSVSVTGRRPKFTATADNPRPYKCDQCFNEYAKAKHLSRHKLSHARKFCEECQQSFSQYAEHMRKEHNVELPRPFECDICLRCYRTKSNIQAHMRIHRAENRVFACKLCSKSFFYGTDLRKHIRTHSTNRSVICDVCGDAFKSVDTLKTHVRRHTGEKPFHCVQCSRSFTTSHRSLIIPL